MRILLCSHVFAPSIGGIETVTAVLAEQWSRMGEAVTVITQTPGGPDCREYTIVRRPSLLRVYTLARQADLVFQNHISLRTLLPALCCGKPIVITHQTYLHPLRSKPRWRDRLKRWLLARCRNISISEAVGAELPVPSIVIGNPFESGEFSLAAGGKRERDIVFMGRLVSDKGCDVVLRALAILRSEGVAPSFTVIGDGQQAPALKKLSVELGIAGQVEFRGAMRDGRGRALAQHKIMVVPSLWAEPFGIVALEGLAAGCVVIASRTGGLPEAVGPCGLLILPGDVEELAAALKGLLFDAGEREKFLSGRDHHLTQFQPAAIATRYLQYFATMLGEHTARQSH